MPRYLYLLRHAQSADKQIGQADKERTLTAKGSTESNAVGNFLKEKSLIPDLIITSSAVRAKTTAQVVARILFYDSDRLILRDDLYEAYVSIFSQIVRDINDDINRVMIVGHNPTITLFLDHISQQVNKELHPAELVVLKFGFSSWKEVNSEKFDVEVLERFHPKV